MPVQSWDWSLHLKRMGNILDLIQGKAILTWLEKLARVGDENRIAPGNVSFVKESV